ncbi:hypothetical protein [Streptomyces sp. NPDC058613]|uniref:hypothetical protein n=1 Tax=unclassified Streptomyces TaxID=2593676 RepID=UPI00364A9D68
MPAQGTEQAHLDHATPAGLPPDTLSDRGNAKLFVRLYSGDYRHVPGLGWYRLGHHPLAGRRGRHRRLGRRRSRRGDRDNRPPRPAQQPVPSKHRRRALSTSGMNAILTQAKSAPGMVLRAELLDADPYALCTERSERPAQAADV